MTYTTLIDAAVRAGRLGVAEELLRAMAAAGVTPNIVTFNVMLRGYCAGSAHPLQARARAGRPPCPLHAGGAIVQPPCTVNEEMCTILLPRPFYNSYRC